MTLFRNIQAFPLAVALSSPLLALGCSTQVRTVDETSLTPPQPVPAHESRDWMIPLAMLLMAGSANYIAWRHFKWRGTHEYLMGRAAGLTLQEDVKRVEKRLEASAGDRDHWHAEFLTDLTKASANGFLRPASGRDEEIRHVLKVRNRRVPVIRTVVAPSGTGKSRLAEGIAYAVTHDRSGRHFRNADYDAANRLLPDVDPEKTLCYRLNLGLLTHPDAEAMFHYLMERAERIFKEGGHCLVIIDGAHALFESANQPAAARLLNLIHGWTDGQMQRSQGLWGVALMSDDRYEAHVQKDTERWRRYERYDLPVLSGKRLEALVWSAAEEWRKSKDVTISDEVLDRALELSLHPKNRTPNPYSVLNLLDGALSETEEGGVLTAARLNETFAGLHRLPTDEISGWSVYAEVLEALRKKLSERLPVLKQEEYFSLRDKLAESAFKKWKIIELPSGETATNVPDALPDTLPDTLIDATVHAFREALERRRGEAGIDRILGLVQVKKLDAQLNGR